MQAHRTLLPRFSLAVPMSLMTTTALLLLMHSLIDDQREPPDAAELYRITEFVRLIEDRPPHTPTPESPPRVEEPPRWQPPEISELGGPEPLDVSLKAPERHVPGVQRAGGPDGDMLPILKVTPVYPRRGIRLGIEGYVVVRFDVDELGRVQSPIVMEAQPAGVFDRAALEAVRKFKYKPRVLDGRAVRVTGVQHRVTFELER